jgi:hypothetical protein
MTSANPLLSANPLAFDESRARREGSIYLLQFIGVRGTMLTWDDEVIVGTVERFEGTRPILRFSDGRWGFGSGSALYSSAV